MRSKGRMLENDLIVESMGSKSYAEMKQLCFQEKSEPPTLINGPDEDSKTTVHQPSLRQLLL